MEEESSAFGRISGFAKSIQQTKLFLLFCICFYKCIGMRSLIMTEQYLTCIIYSYITKYVG